MDVWGGKCDGDDDEWKTFIFTASLDVVVVVAASLYGLCALCWGELFSFIPPLARSPLCMLFRRGAGKFVKNWKLNLKALRIHSMWKCWMFMFFGSNALACSAVHFALIITFFSHFPHLFSLERRREIYIHFDSHTHHSSLAAQQKSSTWWMASTNEISKNADKEFHFNGSTQHRFMPFFSEWAGDWVDEFSVDNHQNSCLNRKMFFLRNLFLKWHSMLLLMLLMLLWVSILTFRHDRSASFQEVVIHLNSAVAQWRDSVQYPALECSLFDDIIW